ncbi:hypothetical protein BZA77DRAFT_291721 [Pyronema omphalodes]|nr:hypothetical protein BZA77DRAFT_291721 [Pyronema omphalodes]
MFSSYGASIYHSQLTHDIPYSHGYNTPVRTVRTVGHLTTYTHAMKPPQADCIAFALNGECPKKQYCRYRHLSYDSFGRDCRYWVESGGTRCANQEKGNPCTFRHEGTHRQRSRSCLQGQQQRTYVGQSVFPVVHTAMNYSKPNIGMSSPVNAYINPGTQFGCTGNDQVDSRLPAMPRSYKSPLREQCRDKRMRDSDAKELTPKDHSPVSRFRYNEPIPNSSNFSITAAISFSAYPSIKDADSQSYGAVKTNPAVDLSAKNLREKLLLDKKMKEMKEKAREAVMNAPFKRASPSNTSSASVLSTDLFGSHDLENSERSTPPSSSENQDIPAQGRKRKRQLDPEDQLTIEKVREFLQRLSRTRSLSLKRINNEEDVEGDTKKIDLQKEVLENLCCPEGYVCPSSQDQAMADKIHIWVLDRIQARIGELEKKFSKSQQSDEEDEVDYGDWNEEEEEEKERAKLKEEAREHVFKAIVIGEDI